MFERRWVIIKESHEYIRGIKGLPFYAITNYLIYKCEGGIKFKLLIQI